MAALGELETLILMAVLRLGETYGVPIRDEIEARTGRRLSRGAVYTALSRLERKGLLDSTVGDPTPVRGGKSKRFYSVSEAGLESLRESMRAVALMRAGLDAQLGDP